MGLIEDFYGRLSTYPGLVALVNDRIWPVEAEQGVKEPYCVYEQVSGGRRYSHSGYSNLQRSRMQVNCYADTFEAAKEIAAQVTAALESWSEANVKAVGSFQQNEIDMIDIDTGFYVVMVDFFVWYKG
jgi:gamma-glutamylcysteine synthetase